MELFGGVSETVVRLFAFVGVLVLMGTLELVSPKRKLRASRVRRWVTNLAIIATDNLFVRLMALSAVPLVAIAAAVFAEGHGLGLFNRLAWPGSLEVLASIILLDFALWLQHVASHRITLLWRLHQMHHADPDIDVTTAIRFHPIEIMLSMLWKILWVMALGISPLAVLLFEVILNSCAMFSHANVALPPAVDRLLRRVIVTPDMHRVHHSVLVREHDANFGFNLSVWDRLFGTYIDQPEKGHEGMTIGLASYQSDGPTRILWNLALPFRRLKENE
ncbi:MAG: sterol desaturase family protein [Hyphomicrobium sp.]|jgi:sterol desaturase/sphingolipid hydroxylase (fatty acid hydroxylase superfamily)